MADILSGFPDQADEITAPAAETSGEFKKGPMLRKKERRLIKKHTKALRKHNKLMKQEIARKKAEEESIEKTSAKNADKSRRDNGIWNFLRKLGDAVCMAIPGILTALTGAIIKVKIPGNVKQAA